MTDQTLIKAAKTYGFSVTDVPRDGNCFFYVIELQLRALQMNDDRHDVIREKVVAYIRKHQATFSDFITDDELDALARDTTWADHTSVIAISRMYNVNMVLVRDDEEAPTIIRQINAQATFYLGYNVGAHYQSLAIEEGADLYQINHLIENTAYDQSGVVDQNEGEVIEPISDSLSNHESTSHDFDGGYCSDKSDFSGSDIDSSDSSDSSDSNAVDPEATKRSPKEWWDQLRISRKVEQSLSLINESHFDPKGSYKNKSWLYALLEEGCIRRRYDDEAFIVVDALIKKGATPYDDEEAIHLLYHALSGASMIKVLKRFLKENWLDSNQLNELHKRQPWRFDGEPLLHVAVEKDSLELVNAFLDAGIDAKIPSTTGKPTLFAAIERANYEIVNALIHRAELDPNTQYRYRTYSSEAWVNASCLYIAIRRLDNDIAVALFEAGADMNFEVNGQSCWQFAVQQGTSELIYAYLKWNPDKAVEVLNYMADKKYAFSISVITPFLEVQQARSRISSVFREITNHLINLGSEDWSERSAWFEIFVVLEHFFPEEPLTEGELDTILHHIEEWHYNASIATLFSDRLKNRLNQITLEKKPWIFEEYLYSPANVRSIDRYLSEREEALKISEYPDSVMAEKTRILRERIEGEKIFVALSDPKEEEAQLLDALHARNALGQAGSKRQYEFGFRTRDADNLLHAAARGNHGACIELLVSDEMYAKETLRGRALEINNRGESPLHDAIKSGCIGGVRALIALGADVNALDADGMRPLLLAAKYKSAPIVESLLIANAETSFLSYDPSLYQDFSADKVEELYVIISLQNLSAKEAFNDFRMPVVQHAISKGKFKIAAELIRTTPELTHEELGLSEAAFAELMNCDNSCDEDCEDGIDAAAFNNCPAILNYFYEQKEPSFDFYKPKYTKNLSAAKLLLDAGFRDNIILFRRQLFREELCSFLFLYAEYDDQVYKEMLTALFEKHQFMSSLRYIGISENNEEVHQQELSIADALLGHAVKVRNLSDEVMWSVQLYYNVATEKAILEGYAYYAKKWCDEGALPTMFDDDLKDAAFQNELRALQLPDSFSKDADLESLFKAAAEQGLWHLIEGLLKSDSLKKCDFSPLSWAIKSGNENATRRLLSLGCELDRSAFSLDEVCSFGQKALDCLKLACLHDEYFYCRLIDQLRKFDMVKVTNSKNRPVIYQLLMLSDEMEISSFEQDQYFKPALNYFATLCFKALTDIKEVKECLERGAVLSVLPYQRENDLLTQEVMAYEPEVLSLIDAASMKHRVLTTYLLRKEKDVDAIWTQVVLDANVEAMKFLRKVGYWPNFEMSDNNKEHLFNHIGDYECLFKCFETHEFIGPNAFLRELFSQLLKTALMSPRGPITADADQFKTLVKLVFEYEVSILDDLLDTLIVSDQSNDRKAYRILSEMKMEVKFDKKLHSFLQQAGITHESGVGILAANMRLFTPSSEPAEPANRPI